MEEFLIRIWENMIGRVDGPMKFRLLLQPTTAAIFAIRAAIQDVRNGRPPFFWSLFTDPVSRRELLRSGWQDIGRVCILAFVMDAIYQLYVLHWFYPGEALTVTLLLAVVPYILIRGPLNRLLRLWRGPVPEPKADTK